MKRILFLFLFITSTVVAQVTFNKKVHDFGELQAYDDRFTDFIITNKSPKTVFILRVDVDRRFKVLYSTKRILPDSSAIVRIQISPFEKGKFNEKIPIYLSDRMDAVDVRMKGDLKDINISQTKQCPSFDQKDINREQSFDFKATVLDRNTRRPIEDAKINLISNGMLAHQLETNKRGFARKTIRLGLYYFYTQADGYVSNDRVKYVNRNNDSILIWLDKKEEEPVASLPPPIDDPVVTIEPEKIDPIDSVEIIIEETEPDLTLIEIPTNEPIETGDLPLSKYKPNNVVFLLDISSSMNIKGRFDLLKASMISLTQILRDVDNVTMVSYATSARILMPTTTGDQKEDIINTVQDLKAQGLTAGSAGMKLAYEQAVKSFIPNANNQIIMITDGGFNRGEINVSRMVKKYLKKGITISVVGVKNRDIEIDSMKDVARKGKGHYIHINAMDNAIQALITEIKLNSKR